MVGPCGRILTTTTLWRIPQQDNLWMNQLEVNLPDREGAWVSVFPYLADLGLLVRNSARDMLEAGGNG